MKRSVHLEPLSHDHFEGLQVARRLRKGLGSSAPRHEMEAYVVHFWDTYLTAHFRQEEELVVPALEMTGGAELAEQMVSEHRTLGALVDVMRGETTDTDPLEDFATMLKAHIRFEERQVFPQLEERLDEEDLQSIGLELHARHVDADLSWHVPFWE